MARRTVQDLLIERLDHFEAKLDEITTKAMPALLVEVAKITTRMKEEVKAEAKMSETKTRIWASVGGGVTLLVSLCSLAIAYLRK